VLVSADLSQIELRVLAHYVAKIRAARCVPERGLPRPARRADLKVYETPTATMSSTACSSAPQHYNILGQQPHDHAHARPAFPAPAASICPS